MSRGIQTMRPKNDDDEERKSACFSELVENENKMVKKRTSPTENYKGLSKKNISQDLKNII